MESIYMGVSMMGLIHGLEPGHGWPLALVYATPKKYPLLSAFLSSGILSFFHLFSSIAVVVVYLLFRSTVNFFGDWMTYFGSGLLFFLAFRFFLEKPRSTADAQHGHFHDGVEEMEHEHEHQHPGQEPHSHIHQHARRVALTLGSLALSAFLLGFAHEEEFALLALMVGGINPFVLMIFYAFSVSLGLVGMTLIGLFIYQKVQRWIQRYEPYFPRVSGVILIVLALRLLLG